ncbi:secreted RxLR effector protein 161-like [Nicotiana tabacum]|uniref:Secreted RxLR effector protein 161-like n=1 Tax=Nicotiana tabacum TaxID=4097 RepID=A0AC58TQM1_TOBAC
MDQIHELQILVSKLSDLEVKIPDALQIGIKGYNTPYDSSVKLTANTGRAVAQLEYASAIGSMMYAMHCTRPDIAFAVCKLSRFTSNPEGYSDASWITSVNDNKSTSGWIFTLGGGDISRTSKKQTCISHSTMESEFIALAAAGKEAEWLRNIYLI